MAGWWRASVEILVAIAPTMALQYAYAQNRGDMPLFLGYKEFVFIIAIELIVAYVIACYSV